MAIHSTAVISKEAQISPTVEIGPFCVIKGKVRIGDGCVLESHVSLGNEWGTVELGKNVRLHPGAFVGGPPQDLSYKGEPTQLIIGDNTAVREFATINCGTAKGGGITRVGANCLIMSYAHVAHDCQIGNHVVMANSVQLAGHVTFEDHVKVNGMCGFNQFVHVGEHAFIAGDSAVHKDVLPYTIAQGKYAVMRAANRIGLERAGYPKADIEAVHRAVRIITMGEGTVEERAGRIESECESNQLVRHFIERIKAAVSGPRGLAL